LLFEFEVCEIRKGSGKIFTILLCNLLPLFGIPFPKKTRKIFTPLYVVFYHFGEYLFPKGVAVLLDVEKLFPE